MKTNKIGFIGLGIMGKPMAKNLIKAGYQMVIYDIKEENLAQFRALGAECAANPGEVAEKVNVVITMVPNSPHVRAVCLGENGIVSKAHKGLVVIDMSSIDPTESRAKIGRAHV